MLQKLERAERFISSWPLLLPPSILGAIVSPKCQEWCQFYRSLSSSRQNMFMGRKPPYIYLWNICLTFYNFNTGSARVRRRGEGAEFTTSKIINNSPINLQHVVGRPWGSSVAKLRIAKALPIFLLNLPTFPSRFRALSPCKKKKKKKWRKETFATFERK